MRLKLRHHVMDGGGGNGEADADAAARRREDHRVHADDLAAQIEGRAAGIAAIDRRVDLDEVGIGPCRCRGRSTRRCPRSPSWKGRRDCRPRPPSRRRAAWRSSPNSTVGSGLSALIFSSAMSVAGIGADQLGVESAAVGQLDGDLLAVFDHVIVGDDEAGLVDDEAGAGAIALCGALRTAGLVELVEEIAERRGQIRPADRRCRRRWSWSRTVMVTTAGLTRSTRSAKLKGAQFSSMRGVARAAHWRRAGPAVVGDAGRSVGGRSAKAPRPTTRMAAALPIARRRGAGAAQGGGRLLGIGILGLHHALLEAGVVRPRRPHGVGIRPHYC